MNKLTYIALALIASITVTSCTKVIDVNLNNTEPVVVIEGNITDTTGPYTIKITSTIDIDKDNNFPGVSGAIVRIADNAGNVETLQEKGSGIYQTQTLQGVPGRTYTLTVVTDGKTYTAESTMPAKVAYDSLNYEYILTFDGDLPYPAVHYTDPIGTGQYYRAKRYVNGVYDNQLYIESDEFIDGKSREAVLFNGDDDVEETLVPGDIITVEMQCIDKANYEYLEQLIEADGSSQSATPANPKGNISNGALGYFTAHTTSVKTLPLPPIVK